MFSPSSSQVSLQSLDFGDTRATAWIPGRPSEFECPVTKDSRRRFSSLNITEKIGGDDVSDWVKLDIRQTAYIELTTQNAIAEIVNARNRVVVGSDDAYESKLTATLQPGTYYLHFSSESSLSEIFTSKFAVQYC
jgi:hypothetical protein